MSNIRNFALSGAAAAALVWGGSAAAQPASNVGELVVTANSLEETLPLELAKLGSDVAVIGSETIRNNSYIDPSQALQMQTPGLYLAPQAGPFSYVDISLQGSRSGDVLWLVDGVRINNRLYTSTSPADTLPASMIERIEVLKGGQGLFYGTQAAAGVINVVTRAFSDKPGGEITVGGDTNESVRLNGYGRGAVGKHQFVAWASKDQSQGYRTFDVIQPSVTKLKRSYDVVSGGLKYGYNFTDDLRLQAQVQHTEAELAYPGARLTAESHNDRNEDIIAARLDYTPDGPAQFYLKGYYHDWDTHYTTINNVPGRPGEFNVVDRETFWGYNDYGLNAMVKLRLHRGFEYDLGYDFQRYKGRDDVLLIGEQSEEVHAAIAQVRTTEDLIKNARLAAGVRYNKTKNTSATIWNVSGRYDIGDNLYVEGVGGTSFILPSAEQLFAIDPCCAAGNPNLEPEKSLNLNASVGGKLAALQGVTWQLTGFARRIDNLITDVPSDLPQFPEGLYMNAEGRVKVTGLEALASAALTPDLRLEASYTYTRAREKGSTQQFIRIPTQLAKASLTYAPAMRPYGASVSAIWTGNVYQNVTSFGRRNYGDYVVVDLAAYVFLDGQRRHHKVTARLENAFDKTYATRINSGLIDNSTQRFLFRNLGTPQTFHLNYSYAF